MNPVSELVDIDLYGHTRSGQIPARVVRVARITRWADHVRVYTQIVLAAIIAVLILAKVVVEIYPVTEFLIRHDSYLLSLVANPILASVGEVLAFSAAVDLAYMLFTPGPDEAVGPVIVGIAAATLILVSYIKEVIGQLMTANSGEIQALAPHHVVRISEVGLLVLSILLLVCSMGLLFYIKQSFIDTENRRQ